MGMRMQVCTMGCHHMGMLHVAFVMKHWWVRLGLGVAQHGSRNES